MFAEGSEWLDDVIASHEEWRNGQPKKWQGLVGECNSCRKKKWRREQKARQRAREPGKQGG